MSSKETRHRRAHLLHFVRGLVGVKVVLDLRRVRVCTAGYR